jgi:ribosomal protein S18 acetylase RimI-like enzyme
MIRELLEADAEAFQRVRTRALLDHPEAFFSSPEEELPLPELQRRLRERINVIVGAFDPGLVGTVGVRRETFKKGAHKAYIWGVYVAPEARRRHLGRELLRRALEHARTMGVELVQLTVSTQTPAARALYASEGFVTWGIEPDALRVNGTSHAEEHMFLRL